MNRNEKVRQWLIDTTTDILSNHFSDKNEDGAAYELLNQLKKISSNLCLDQSNTLQLFQEFCGLITEPSVNVSSFELTHSNLVHQLLRIFSCSPMVLQNRIVWQEFLHIFFLSPPPNTPLKTTWELPKIDTLPVLKLVQILQNCVNQSEQFSVKSDLGGSSGSQQFFRFINNHQIKCQLVRHQSDKQSKEWKKRKDTISHLYLDSLFSQANRTTWLADRMCRCFYFDQSFKGLESLLYAFNYVQFLVANQIQI